MTRSRVEVQGPLVLKIACAFSLRSYFLGGISLYIFPLNVDIPSECRYYLLDLEVIFSIYSRRSGTWTGGGGIWVELSGKMNVLARLLSHLRQKTDDRIVLVSNYTQVIPISCMQNIILFLFSYIFPISYNFPSIHYIGEELVIGVC